MLEYSIYAVASPEACASIVLRDKSKANEAAKAMKVDAESLIKFGLIDEVISEPLGGAHRDLGGSCHLISNSIEKTLNNLNAQDIDEILKRRYEKIMSYGLV